MARGGSSFSAIRYCALRLRQAVTIFKAGVLLSAVVEISRLATCAAHPPADWAFRWVDHPAVLARRVSVSIGFHSLARALGKALGMPSHSRAYRAGVGRV